MQSTRKWEEDSSIYAMKVPFQTRIGDRGQGMVGVITCKNSNHNIRGSFLRNVLMLFGLCNYFPFIRSTHRDQCAIEQEGKRGADNCYWKVRLTISVAGGITKWTFSIKSNYLIIISMGISSISSSYYQPAFFQHHHLLVSILSSV